MRIETAEFVVDRVQWESIPNNERRSDGLRGFDIRGNVQAVAATCKKCRHSWAANRPPELHVVRGGIHITCPECGQRGHIPDEQLR